MLTWTRAFEKVSDYVPWAPWVVGGGYRLGDRRLRRHAGLEDGGPGYRRRSPDQHAPRAASRRREAALGGW